MADWYSASDINPKTGKAYAVRPDGIWDDNYWASLEKTLPGYQEYRAREDAKRVAYDREQAQTKLLETQKLERDNRFASQKQEIGDFTTEYENKTPQIFDEVYNKFQIPTQTNAVNALNARIQDLKFNETGGATGYASAGQVDKAINTNYLPRFNTAVTNLNNSLAAGKGEFDMRMMPLETKGKFLSDRLAREITSYDTAQQNELQALISLYEMKGNLSTAQWEMANRLALKQMDYDATVKEIESRERIANDGGGSANRYISVGSKTQLYDTKTGQFISAPGASGGGGAAIGGGYTGMEAKPSSPPPYQSAWIVQ